MYRNRTLEERAAKGLSRAVPDRFVHFYKRLDGTHQQEVRLSQLHAYTVPHKVESKRGFEFYQLPYYDERTDQEHGGQPQIELSEKTKTEFRWVLENCLRRGIQPVALTSASIEHATVATIEHECFTCQGKHHEDECQYACHRCISIGPLHEHEECPASLRYSNVSQDYTRALVLYQAWPPGTDSPRQAVYNLRRRPRFRPIPRRWLVVYELACGDFNGRVLLVDLSTYNQWLKGHKAKGGGAIEPPIRFPYRMIAFLNVEFSIDLLKNIYIPAVRLRQQTRFACPNVLLSQRRYFDGQQEPDGGFLMENLQEIVECIMVVEQYKPDENELHSVLGHLTPGAKVYIYPHGRFIYHRDGRPNVSSYKYFQTLKEAPVHPDGDTSRLRLVWDSFAGDDGPVDDDDDEQEDGFDDTGTERASNGFNFAGDEVRHVKRPWARFQKLVDASRLPEQHRQALRRAFDGIPQEVASSPDWERGMNRLLRMGVGLWRFEELCQRVTRCVETPDGVRTFYVKAGETEFEDRLARSGIDEQFFDALRHLYRVSPDESVVEPADRKFHDALNQLPVGFDYDYFMTLAYYRDTAPKPVAVDVAYDEGLRDLERTLDVFEAYRAHIEDPAAARRSGIVELFGGILRVICECYYGGPSHDTGMQAAFTAQLDDRADVSKSLWPASGLGDAVFWEFISAVLDPGVELDNPQRAALLYMVRNRIFVLIGMPGSGKTKLTCAAMLFCAFYYGERILILTETNIGAHDMYTSLAEMVQRLEETYPDEMAMAKSRASRGGRSTTYRWVTRSMASDRDFEEEDREVERVCQTKGRKIVQDSRIVVSTIRRARSKAVQLYRADVIVMDESARSCLINVLGLLLERWLNTSLRTTKIKPDMVDGVRIELHNPHPTQRLILVGDPRQALPQLLNASLTDKRTSWAIGENLNILTCAMQCGASFVRLSRSFGMPYWSAQPLFDRFYNYRLGSYADARTPVVAVKDAPLDVVRRFDLPQITGTYLECPSVRRVIDIDGFKNRYASDDSDENLRLRFVLIKTNPPPGYAPLSVANKLGSQENAWHRQIIFDLLRALFTDGWLVKADGSRERVTGKHILITTPYKGQLHAIRRELHEHFPNARLVAVEKMKVMTLKTVQGLERPSIITDYTKSTPSDFLLGHHTHDFQSHHNSFYSVGLSRHQVAQFTVSAMWPVEQGTVEFARRTGPTQERVEESYLSWQARPANDREALGFSRPGDRIPEAGQPPTPIVDITNDNLWLFFIFSEKRFSQATSRWTLYDGYHWQRGVGCVSLPPRDDYDDYDDDDDVPCTSSGRGRRP